MATQKTKTYEFIPEVREHILAGIPLAIDRKYANESIDRWERGDKPRTPVEVGISEVCEAVRKRIEASDEDGHDEEEGLDEGEEEEEEEDEGDY